MESLPEIVPEDSVLFLGAGFSRGALNIRNEALPSGKELKSIFANLLGLPNSAYDINTLAEEISSRPDLNLYQLLYELFTVKSLNDFQIALLQKRWRRIYTTNYDDAVEYVYHAHCRGDERNKVIGLTYNYDDPKPSRIPHGAIVHLHGVIRKCSPDNVLTQLVLNETSYVRQHFDRSLWYDEFLHDLRYCDSCYFVGYSLEDYHISSLLMQDPHISNKTYFIAGKHVDNIFANRVRNYGKVLPLDAEAFADVCAKAKKAAPLTNPLVLKSFQSLDPNLNRKSLEKPTSLEVLRLLAYGNYNIARFHVLPKVEYVIPREPLVLEAVRKLIDARCLLIHSDLGNGKTIFLYILNRKLSSNGYQCFMCRPNALPTTAELDYINKLGKVAILFDSYHLAADLMGLLAGLSNQVKFIVAVRTGIQDVRWHEIVKQFPAPLERINLNTIKEADRENFNLLLAYSGLAPDDFANEITNCTCVRDIVLKFFHHDEIIKKINSDLAVPLGDDEFKHVFTVCHLMKWAGFDADDIFVRRITGKDAYAIANKYREIASDILTLSGDTVQSKSSVFSEYLIKNVLDPNVIVDCVFSIVVEAAKKIGERKYQAILGHFMQFSKLQRALHRADYLTLINNLYDRWQRDVDINKEPLFWLQYSILMLARAELEAAERFLETSYQRASEISNFKTYQIDTHALRLLMHIERQNNNRSQVDRFDRIREKLARVRSMIGDESHRYHAINVIAQVEPFVVARVHALSQDEKNVLVYEIHLIIERLSTLPNEVRLALDIEAIKASMQRALNMIITNP